MNDILTDSEVADMLGCEPGTINERAASGDLPAIKFGRSWRFPREALLKVLNEKALANKPARPAPPAVQYSSPERQSRRRRAPTLPSLTVPTSPRP